MPPPQERCAPGDHEDRHEPAGYQIPYQRSPGNVLRRAPASNFRVRRLRAVLWCGALSHRLPRTRNEVGQTGSDSLIT